jgi:hypothetical protein
MKDGIASLCLFYEIDRIPYFDIRYSKFDIRYLSATGGFALGYSKVLQTIQQITDLHLLGTIFLALITGQAIPDHFGAPG